MTTYGTFFELGGRAVMEALSQTGLDYVIIDTEHGPFSVENTADCIVAAERHGIKPFVRIGGTDRTCVLRMLDIGARGLIVPNIRSVDEARRLVEAAKFPPIGKRGFCPNRTSGWGAQEWAHDVMGYMNECNTRVKVIPQCETKEAVEHIEQIVALDGVDGIMVGPFDLSVDLGLALQLDHPVVLESINRVLIACKEAGKESGIFVSTPEYAAHWIEAGFDSIVLSLDADVLITGYQAMLEQMHTVEY